MHVTIGEQLCAQMLMLKKGSKFSAVIAIKTKVRNKLHTNTQNNSTNY